MSGDQPRCTKSNVLEETDQKRRPRLSGIRQSKRNLTEKTRIYYYPTAGLSVLPCEEIHVDERRNPPMQEKPRTETCSIFYNLRSTRESMFFFSKENLVLTKSPLAARSRRIYLLALVAIHLK